MKKAPSTKKTRARREIKRLTEELECERRENARLRRKLTSLRKRESRSAASDAVMVEDKPLRRKKLTPTEETQLKFNAHARRAERFGKRSFVQFFIRSIMESSMISAFGRVLRYFRRLRVVRTVATIITPILAVLAVTAVSLSILPFLFIGVLIALTLGLIRARRMNRIMRRALNGQHIRIIIPPSDFSFEDKTFLSRSTLEMAARGDCTVLMIAPGTWSTKGLGGKGLYFTARRESEYLYLVRRHYYFILRRCVLDVVDGELCVMY